MNVSQPETDGLDDQVRMIDESAHAILRNDRERARKLRFTKPGFDRAKWAEFADLGWLMLRLGEDSGGLGLGMRELCTISTRMGQELTPEPVLAAALVASVVPAAQRDRLFAGDEIILPAFAAFGNKPPVLTENRLTGKVAPILSGLAADAFVVQTENGAALLQADAPGVALIEQPSHDGGYFGVLSMDAAVAQHIDSDMGRIREEATLATAAYLLGLADSALALTLEYMKERVQFNKPIGSFQALQHRCVDMLLELRLGQAALNVAVSALDSKQDSNTVALNVSLAKARATRACRIITQEAIQFHGGIGYTDEADIGLYLRKCMAISGTFGSEQFHRNRAFSLLER